MALQRRALAVGLGLLVGALAVGGYGIWLISTEDLQGGRDAVGVI